MNTYKGKLWFMLESVKRTFVIKKILYGILRDNCDKIILYSAKKNYYDFKKIGDNTVA